MHLSLMEIEKKEVSQHFHDSYLHISQLLIEINFFHSQFVIDHLFFRNVVVDIDLSANRVLRDSARRVKYPAKAAKEVHDIHHRV